MVLELWKNPEFIRHCRSELRRNRAMAVALIVIMICALTILACWASEREKRKYTSESYVVVYVPSQAPSRGDQPPSKSPHEAIPGTTVKLFPDTIQVVSSREAYHYLMLMQFAALTFWSLLSCTQAVSRERERGTWDFQRTTRLSPGELLIGKLFGEPILAYFIFFCSLPIVVAVGLEGRIGIEKVLATYILWLTGAVFIGLAGLLLSSLFENKSRGIGLIGGLAMYGVFLASQAFAESPFPGLAAFSPLTTFLPLNGELNPSPPPTVFGAEVPWLMMTLLLYATFGAWLALMLVRNLKRDFQEVRPLSRWQAVGYGVFLNIVFYALFSPAHLFNASQFMTFMVAMNGLIFFLLGLTMLSSQERLDAGTIFSLRSMFSDYGLQWPWLLVLAFISYLLLVSGLFAWKRTLGFDALTVKQAAIGLLVLLVFATRDVLFIQWCHLTRMRAPLLKGILLLCLYYASSGVVCLVLNVTSVSAATAAGNILTPVGPFNQSNSLLPVSELCGIVIQLMAIGFLVSAIRSRVERTRRVAATI
jgi:hypothetical protein